MRRFIQGSHGQENYIEQLNDISFQNILCIKKIDGKTFIWGRKYSTSVEWGPSSGLSFQKFIPNQKVYASKLLLLQSTIEFQNA